MRVVVLEMIPLIVTRVITVYSLKLPCTLNTHPYTVFLSIIYKQLIHLSPSERQHLSTPFKQHHGRR
jgi:hypothetical protein